MTNKESKTRETFHKAVARIDKIAAQGEFDSGLSATLQEIKARLAQIQSQFERLIKLNGEIRNFDPLRIEVEIDPKTGEFRVSVGGKPAVGMGLKFAGPEFPVEPRQSVSTGVYTAGHSHEDDPPELAGLRRNMERELEEYYYAAHRIVKLIPKLPGAKKTKATAVTFVRNLLIEHPPDGALYTFGWSDAGPRIKPLHRGDLKYNDEGLIPNTEDFLTEVLRCLPS